MSEPSRTRTAAVPTPDILDTTESGSVVPQQSVSQDRTDDLQFAASPITGDLGRLGRYRIQKRLGAGGMGAVYLAHDDTLNRRLALKVMLPKFATNPQAKARFLREARTAARVNSNHVIAILDVDEIDGIPFIAMEYLQGVPLDRYLAAHPGLSIPQVLRFGLEVTRGLAAAHELGLVHRDIKPANLFLESPHGRVKILDFGLAKETEPSDDGGITRTGQVVGTPAFMSPEQARGEAVDARSDLFSLGIVLYKLATGRQPFRGPTPMAVLMALGMDDPTPVREINPAVPPALADLIHRLLAKQPARRPQSAIEVHAALTALDDGSAPAANATPAEYVPIDVPVPTGDGWGWVGDAAETDSVVETLEPRRKPFPFLAVGGALAAVVAAGLLVAVALNFSKPKPVAESEPSDFTLPIPTAMTNPSREPPKSIGERKAAESLHSQCSLKLLLASGKEVTILPLDPLPAESYTVAEARLDHAAVISREVFLAGVAEFRTLRILEIGYDKLSLTDADVVRLAGMPFAETLTGLSTSTLELTPVALAEITKFKKLNQLTVKAEAVDDALLKQLAHSCPGIRQVTFYGFNQSGRVTLEGLASLAGLQLQSLALTGCRALPREWGERIAKMPTLQSIRLLKCGVDDAFLAALVGTKVVSLTCGGPGLNVTDAGMESVAKITTLQTLDLDGAAITDKGLERLTALKALTSLGLVRTNVTMAGVLAIKAALPNCAIRSNVYDPKGDPDRVAAEWVLSKGDSSVALIGPTVYVGKVADLPPGVPLRVTELHYASKTQAFTDADIDMLVPLTALTGFSSGIGNITDAGLEKLSLLQAAAKLTTLNLSGPKFTDEGLKHFGRFRNLSTLSLSYFAKVTGKGFGVLHELPALSKLYLGSSQVNDEGLRHLKRLTSITNLDVRLCPVTDEGIEAIADLPKLTLLNMGGTKITDKSLERLSRAKQLTLLHVTTTKVTAEGVAAFRKAVPTCKVTSDFDNVP